LAGDLDLVLDETLPFFFFFFFVFKEDEDDDDDEEDDDTFFFLIAFCFLSFLLFFIKLSFKK
jgi:hypothetical protein